MGTVKWGQTTILAITRKTRSVLFSFMVCPLFLLACYQMAADKGDQLGVFNVGRLGSSATAPIKASHCI